MNRTWQEIAEEIRRRVQSVVVAQGGARWWIATLIAVAIAAFADVVFHLDRPPARLTMLLAVGAISLFALWRFLLRPLSVSVNDVELARMIERQLGLNDDRLSSAAQFRDTNLDPHLGSPNLQLSTIARADEVLKTLEVERLFARSPARPAVVVAGLLTVLAVIGFFAAPATTALALQRLALPFGDIPWPRTTRLRVLDRDLAPLTSQAVRTTADQPLVMYVENELGELPDDLRLELQPGHESPQQQAVRVSQLRDGAGRAREYGVISLRPVQEAVRFRVMGGDDTGMDWLTVETVPAPGISELLVTVTPPPYTGLAPAIVDASTTFDAVLGSRISLEGRTKTPLSTAVLHREQREPVAMSIDEQGRRIRAEFVIEEPGTAWYWLELRDEYGLAQSHPPRYELRGIADRPPQVHLDQPAADWTVTASAEVPLRVLARDDLGLVDIRLRWTDQENFPLTSGESTTGVAAFNEPTVQGLPLSAPGALEEQIEMVWSLEPLGLAHGDCVTYWAEAVDACPVDGDSSTGQVGASVRRRLFIITDDEKQRELAARQSGLLDALEGLRHRQNQARNTTSQVRIQAELTGELRPAELDLLKQTELEQRNLRQQISDEASGLNHEVQELQQEYDVNRIVDPQTLERLKLLADSLQQLSDRWFPQIEQHLGQARKSAGIPDGHSGSDEELPSAQAGEETTQQLRQAEQGQGAALAVLSEMAQLLGGWQQRFQLSSALDAIVAEQRRLQEETKEVGSATLARSVSRLTPQQQADLARLADRQRRLATQLDDALAPAEAEHSAERDEKSSGNGERTELAEARRWFEEQASAAEMHRAAESLKRNDIASAAGAQEEVLNALRDFAERLRKSPASDPAETLSRLQEAQEEVETFRKRQQELQTLSQRLLTPSADPERDEQLQRLTKHQSDLAEETGALAQALRSQREGRPAGTAERAARRMHDAHDALEREDADGVRENQTDALDDLEQLAQELSQLKAESEAELAEQRLQELADEVRHLADEQMLLSGDTASLDARYKEHGSWSRSLKRELRQLSDRQQTLHETIDEQRSQAENLAVIEAVLTMASEAMSRATTLLNADDAGEATIAAQDEAARRLNDLATTLSASQPDGNSPEGPRPSPPSDTAPRGSNLEKLQIAAQLRLLRAMQASVKERTLGLAPSPEEDDAASKEARAGLAKEQRQIAELSQQLFADVIRTETSEEVPETPEALP